MADQGIKKIIIPRSSLPPAGKNGEYLIRYRIASQDKNRYSHWSPIHKVIGKPLTQVNGRLAVLSNSIVVVAWDAVQNISSYDIFVKYNTQSNYSYHGSTSTNNYSIIKENEQTMYVAVQIGGIFKERRESNTIYTGTLSLV
jgi:hypothetical protein